jgi:hypothetical protein
MDRGAVGNLDLAGADELVLVDEDKGEFNVYRPTMRSEKSTGRVAATATPNA